MFAYLNGTVVALYHDSFVMDVNDIGYMVTASKRTLDNITVEKKYKIHIDPIFRQEMLFLYGFLSLPEKEWFKTLIGVQGVGPRVALSILSIMSIDELINTVMNQDKTMIGRADGVGPKLAGRLLLELKDTVKGLSFSSPVPPSLPVSDDFNDALSALIHLGYTRHEALNTLKLIPSPEQLNSASLIREALQAMQQKK